MRLRSGSPYALKKTSDKLHILEHNILKLSRVRISHLCRACWHCSHSPQHLHTNSFNIASRNRQWPIVASYRWIRNDFLKPRDKHHTCFTCSTVFLPRCCSSWETWRRKLVFCVAFHKFLTSFVPLFPLLSLIPPIFLLVSFLCTPVLHSHLLFRRVRKIAKSDY